MLSAANITERLNVLCKKFPGIIHENGVAFIDNRQRLPCYDHPVFGHTNETWKTANSVARTVRSILTSEAKLLDEPFRIIYFANGRNFDEVFHVVFLVHIFRKAQHYFLFFNPNAPLNLLNVKGKCTAETMPIDFSKEPVCKNRKYSSFLSAPSAVRKYVCTITSKQPNFLTIFGYSHGKCAAVAFDEMELVLPRILLQKYNTAEVSSEKLLWYWETGSNRKCFY